MPRLTDLTVLALASLPRLERLGAAGLPKLTDQAAFFLSEHASALEHLHLSYCARLTLDAVQALLRRLTNLQYLSLSGVPALRRRGVRRFADRPHEVSMVVYIKPADSGSPISDYDCDLSTGCLMRRALVVVRGLGASRVAWHWQVGTSDAARGDAAKREGGRGRHCSNGRRVQAEGRITTHGTRSRACIASSEGRTFGRSVRFWRKRSGGGGRRSG